MSLRVVHAADLHLDSPFESLEADKAVLRRAEQRDMLRRLAEVVKQRRADVLLLPGDLLDGETVYAQTGEMLRDALEEVSIPVFIAPGNHDWYSRRSVYARLSFSENVRIFTQPRLESVSLPSLGAVVWGAGYTSERCGGLLKGFRAPREKGVLNLLVLHAEVGRAASPYCPVTERELAESGIDYAALGHVHTYDGVHTAGRCRYAYAGCPGGRGFDECGPKGVLFLELGEDLIRAEQISLGQREYRRLTAEVGADPLSSVLEALPADAAKHIYKIVLTGESGAELDVARLRRELSKHVFALTLLDETVPARELWDRAGEDTLTGLFLRRMRRAWESAGEEERSLVTQAVRLGLSALEGREVEL